jgi:DNA-directed RNA polymerase specialized sigma24 family protein
MRPEIDIKDLALRLESYGLRVFAEFGQGGRNATIPGVGLSVEDFVSNVLWEYVDGRLAYEADRGAPFSLLAKALRNDIIDALRKASHSREEARASLARENRSENQPPSLDEMPELAAVVRMVIDSDRAKPRELAEELGISVADFQNRKKRLRRRLIEYHAVEVSEA